MSDREAVLQPAVIAQSNAGGAWIVRTRISHTPRLRLFVFASAGRGPAMFRPWAPHIHPDVDLCIVQLPGREARWNESPLLDLGEVCRAVAEAMRHDLDRPFALFGHSLGALIAFEVSRHLRLSMKVIPRALLVAAHRAPHLPNPLPRIGRLPDPEFLQSLNARYGGLPEAAMAHKELMDLILPTLKADYDMAENYRYADGEPLPCAISVFGGVDDQHVSEEELVSWRRHTSATFRHRMMPGGHFFVDHMRGSLIPLLLGDLQIL